MAFLPNLRATPSRAGRRATAAVVAACAVAVLPAGAAQAAAPPIESVETGVHEGRPWVQLRLAEPLPRADETFSAFAAFSIFTPDGVHLSGDVQVHDGEGSTSGRCQPDSTSCPDAPFPVEADISTDRHAITFFFDAPAGVVFDLASLQVRARTGRLDDATSDNFEQLTFPADGSPVAFDPTERDPAGLISAPTRRNAGSDDGDGGVSAVPVTVLAVPVALVGAAAGWFMRARSRDAARRPRDGTAERVSR